MGTIVEFRLLVLDSLKYSSKGESPIDRSTKAVITRNLAASQHNHLFIYLFIYFVFFACFLGFFWFFFFYFFILFFIYFQKTGITVLNKTKWVNEWWTRSPASTDFSVLLLIRFLLKTDILGWAMLILLYGDEDQVKLLQVL